MTTLYKKPHNTLDETERAILNASLEVLKNGDRLYGLSPDDVSHIEYAIGLVVNELSELYTNNNKSIATLIEIGSDETGFFIAFVPTMPEFS